MKAEDLKIVQDISVQILNDITDICEKNDIKYMLLYGTLLGAIRHNNIIPWDNDIDIGMTRDNYLKFIKVAKEQLKPEDQMFIMGSGNPKYMSEIKIGRRNTRFCLKLAKGLNIMDQVSVDIFLIDYIKPLSALRLSIQEKIKRGLKIIKLNWDEKKLLFKCISISNHKFKWFFKLALTLSHVIRFFITEYGIEKLIYMMYVDKSNKSNRLGVVADNYGLRLFSADFKYIEHPFGNRSYLIPTNYDELLSMWYGDYMKLPPVEERYPKNLDKWVLEVDNVSY